MSKYGKYTGGQWEALGNILGGEEVIDKLLRGQVKFVIKSVKPEPGKFMELELCRQEGGSRCSISNCHAQIADGDNVCAHGHQIGQRYEVEVPA